MKKLVLIVVCALILLASVIPSFAEDKPIKAYAISVLSGGPAWGRFEQGFFETCEKYGWEGHYLAPANANESTAMVGLAETALNDGADLLVIVMINEGLFQEILDRAKAQGVTVICLAQGKPEYCAAVTGPDNSQMGALAAETLLKLMEGKPINVAVGQTAFSAEMQNQLYDSFKERLLQDRPDANLVDRFECNGNTTVAADKMSAIYVAHPELNASVVFDSGAALGTASFVGDYGLQGEFTALGIDDGQEILECIKNGTLAATCAQQWYDVGVKCIEVGYQIIVEGKEVEFEQPVPSKAVFAEDVDEYAAAMGIELSK